jgi:hypothetical protein
MLGSGQPLDQGSKAHCTCPRARAQLARLWLTKDENGLRRGFSGPKSLKRHAKGRFVAPGVRCLAFVSADCSCCCHKGERAGTIRTVGWPLLAVSILSHRTPQRPPICPLR